MKKFGILLLEEALKMALMIGGINTCYNTLPQHSKADWYVIFS